MARSEQEPRISCRRCTQPWSLRRRGRSRCGCAHQSVPSTPSFIPITILTHDYLVRVLGGRTSRRRDSRLDGGCRRSCGAVSFTLSLRRFTYSPFYGTMSGRSFIFLPYYCRHGTSTCSVAACCVCKKRFVCMERMIFVCCRCRSPKS